MSAKTNAEVVIGGKVYTLSGFESEEYLQKVASYINGKLAEMEELESFKRFTPDMRAILVELNIADDYYKAKAKVEKLELELEAKDREIYNLKHDLISNQVQTESDTKRLEELEAENKELLLNKARLEATLEESLLGKVQSMRTPQKNESGQHKPQKKAEQPQQHAPQKRAEQPQQHTSQRKPEQTEYTKEADKKNDKGAKGQA